MNMDTDWNDPSPDHQDVEIKIHTAPMTGNPFSSMLKWINIDPEPIMRGCG